MNSTPKPTINGSTSGATNGGGGPNGKTKNGGRLSRVEVRFIDAEAELYLRQWQQRYALMEGINLADKEVGHLGLIESNDDWECTAQRVLDLDVADDLVEVDRGGSLVPDAWDLKALKLFDDWRYCNDVQFSLSLPTTPPPAKKRGTKTAKFGPPSSPTSHYLSPAALLANGVLFGGHDGVKQRPGGQRPATKRVKKVVRNGLQPSYQLNGGDKSPLSTLSTVSSTSSCSLTNHSSLSMSPSPSSASSTSSGAFNRSAATVGATTPLAANKRRQIFRCDVAGCGYASDRHFNFLRHLRTHKKPNAKIKPPLAAVTAVVPLN